MSKHNNEEPETEIYDVYGSAIEFESDVEIPENIAGLSEDEYDDLLEKLGFDEFDFDLEEHELANLPVVAVVGRPNVGKSTFVNRIIGRREAVVEDVPGVTRDRVRYEAEWNGVPFIVVDTGGWESNAKGMAAQVSAQAQQAMTTSDVVLFVVDTNVGATDADEQSGPFTMHGLMVVDDVDFTPATNPTGDGTYTFLLRKGSEWSLGFASVGSGNRLRARVGAADAYSTETDAPAATAIVRVAPAATATAEPALKAVRRGHRERHEQQHGRNDRDSRLDPEQVRLGDAGSDAGEIGGEPEMDVGIDGQAHDRHAHEALAQQIHGDSLPR